MKKIGVECKFSTDGTVSVRRINLDGNWVAVGQGRQWLDQEGRHVLIMLPANESREIILRSDTMSWSMRLPRSQNTIVV